MDAHHHGASPSLAAPELAHYDVVDLVPLGAAPARAVVTADVKVPQAAGGGEGHGKAQSTTDRPDSATDDARRKTLSSLRAELALASGFVLHDLADGSFLVTRWNCCKPLADLEAVAAFARMVGVRHG